MTNEPASVRAVRFPVAYGTPGGPESLRPWSEVEERLHPSIAVHLSSDAAAIILEGVAEFVTDPAHPLAARVAAASRAKYPQYISGTETPFRPFWMLRPTTALAWTLEGFPRGATRWRFVNR